MYVSAHLTNALTSHKLQSRTRKKSNKQVRRKCLTKKNKEFPRRLEFKPHP